MQNVRHALRRNVHAMHRSISATGEVGRVVLIGERKEIASAMEHPALVGVDSLQVVGVVETSSDDPHTLEEAVWRVARSQSTHALVIIGALPRRSLQLLGELTVVLGCRLLSLLPRTNGSGLEPAIVHESGHPMVEVSIALNRQRFDRRKRALDILLAVFGLLIAWPVMLFAIIAIRLESSGAVVFGHVRIGRGGRRFRCWKLRTMHPDAELRLEEDRTLMARYKSNDFKLPDGEDPRITRVGRVLRKTSVDELPQLWNVLVGEMSLVGPRPIVADELQHYRGNVLTLLSVRPGITGAWAVSGRHHLQYPRRAEVELAYVRSRSLVRDMEILLRTFGAIMDPGFGFIANSSPKFDRQKAKTPGSPAA